MVLTGSAFQSSVWRALQAIPAGTTKSYGELAARIGQPTAVRAVGRANGDNRLSIIVPCHRVIGADGALTGYGGGLWRKQKLLDHEREAHGEALMPARSLALLVDAGRAVGRVLRLHALRRARNGTGAADALRGSRSPRWSCLRWPPPGAACRTCDPAGAASASSGS